MHPSKKILASILLIAMTSSVLSSASALTVQDAVTSLQTTDPTLPTGVTNPKGMIGFILATIFGMGNGKIQAQYLDVSGINIWTQSGANAFYSGTGSVGIGTSNPIWGFQTNLLNSSANGVNGITVNAYENGSGINGASLRLAAIRGTSVSPSMTLLWDVLGTINFTGYWGGKTNSYFSNNEARANINALAAENWIDPSHNGSIIIFNTTGIGSNGIMERMRIDANGNIGIGTSSPSTLLTLSGASGPIIGLNGLTTNYRGFKISDAIGNEQWFAGANSSNNYVIRQNASTDLMVFSGGSIGIWGILPKSTLTVSWTLEGLNRFSLTYPTSGVYSGSMIAPYSRLNADSFHTNGLWVGQMYIEGSAMDANITISIGKGLAGGQVAQAVGIGTGSALYVDTSGNATFTQPVTAATPTASSHLATKAYVDAAVGAAGGGLNVYKDDGVTLVGKYLGVLPIADISLVNTCDRIIYANATTNLITSMGPVNCETQNWNSTNSIIYGSFDLNFTTSNCTGTPYIRYFSGAPYVAPYKNYNQLYNNGSAGYCYYGDYLSYRRNSNGACVVSTIASYTKSVSWTCYAGADVSVSTTSTPRTCWAGNCQIK